MWYCGRTVTCCTLIHAAPIFASATPNVTRDINEQQPNSAAIIGLALTLSLLLVLLATISIVIYRRRRKSIQPAPSTPSSADTLLPQTPNSPFSPSLSSSPSSPLFFPTGDGYVQQLPSDQLKVLVLYSLDTPEDEQTKINELLCGGLGRCGMLVETPGTVPNRQFDRERVERAVVEANAVFFVCNDQFYSEWMSEDSTAGCGGGAKIGRDVRMIKNAAGNSTLAKCAFVHFEVSGEELVRRYPKIDTAFITRYFSLSGDKFKAVQSIASFVKNIRKYELGTHYTVSDAP